MATLIELGRDLGRILDEKKRVEAACGNIARRVEEGIGALDKHLAPLGYKLVAASESGKKRGARSKKLQCPKCDRTFAHPLPMMRHLKATHKVNPVTLAPLEAMGRLEQAK